MTRDGRSQRGEVTIRDVARVAGVHISTVSRALDPQKASLVSPDTRARVLEVAEELGYRPHLVAAGLRRGRTRTIGVVVPDLGNPLYAPFTRGVTEALDQAGYMPLVADTQDEHGRFERVLTHLMGRRVDAIIATAARAGDKEALVACQTRGTPVVTAVRTLPSSGLPMVSHDDRGGGRLAAEHLIELGHRRLAQVHGPMDVAPFRARSQGFEEAVARSDATIVCTADPAVTPTSEQGQAVMAAILDAGGLQPTAVFVHNDLMALGAMKALHERRLRCPEDVSLVGYNDLFFAEHTSPPLTTVRLAGYDVGRLTGTMAVQLIDDPDPGMAPVLVPATLVVRASTAPAADA